MTGRMLFKGTSWRGSQGVTYVRREASAEPREVIIFWDAACSASPREGVLPAEKKLQVISNFANERASSRVSMCVHNSSLGNLTSWHCCISAGRPEIMHFDDLASWHCSITAACRHKMLSVTDLRSRLLFGVDVDSCTGSFMGADSRGGEPSGFWPNAPPADFIGDESFPICS